MTLDFLTAYGAQAEHSSLPLGGLGAGMMSFAHNGALESVSIQHKPAMSHHPVIFASLHCRQAKKTRIMQGQYPLHKVLQSPECNGSGNHFGLPSYQKCDFSAGFPFAQTQLSDDRMPVHSTVTAWSPFIPGDDVNSGLPCAILEYDLYNTSDEIQDIVFGFHCESFLSQKSAHSSAAHQMGTQGQDNGFFLESGRIAHVASASSGVKKSPACCSSGECVGERVDPSDLYTSVGVSMLDVDNCSTDCAWLRSSWFDSRVALWDDISSGYIRKRQSHNAGDDRGASINSELQLRAGGHKRIRIVITWYTPQFKLYDNSQDIVTCWYGKKFNSLNSINRYVVENLSSLRTRTENFARALHVNDMPDAFRSAVSRNLAILKSPSFLRSADGTLWGWEGCHDSRGCCAGSCTHVYNYCQAIAFLFPQLERQMRNVEFIQSQENNGYQHFRAVLPLDYQRKENDNFAHAAADGQLGGIIRMYRDWHISGENDWLRSMWPAIKQSLEFCIQSWDIARNGRLAEPHHNTYDVEFWGEDGLCSTIYAGALQAAIRMAQFLGEEIQDWPNVLSCVQAVIRDELYQGWIRQNVHWKDLQSDNHYDVSICSQEGDNSPEAIALVEKEGPRYQYGDGVLIDGALGCQLSRIAGLGVIIDEDIEAAHLDAVMTHNFKKSLREHACFQRPGYAIAQEGGTLMCTWPEGGRLSIPFPYSDEVWTGCEHQFAAHLCMLGRIEDAIQVEQATQGRYNGHIRNPFNEMECGYFYVRALASYGLVPAYSGAHYNAIDKIMELRPSISGDFTCFFAVGSAWGQIGVCSGQPFLDLIEGELEIKEWKYSLCLGK